MKRVLIYLVALIFGAGIGITSALGMAGLLPGGLRTGGGLDISGWQADFTMGSAEASPYVRARVARHGLLALAHSEAVYLTRVRDDGGDLLNQNCVYRMVGGAMPADWWSVTLYDQASFLPSNTDSALSYDASRAGGEPWEAIIAADKPADGSAWISSRNAGQFDLTLRLYVPQGAMIEDPASVLTPPTLTRISCAKDAS